MRLNKIEKDLAIKDLKLNFSKFWTKVKIFVGGSFLVANIAACTPAVEDVDATSMAPTTTTESVVPSSSEEVTPSTEVVDSTEVTPSTDVVEPTETTDVVDPTEVVDDNIVADQDTMVNLIEGLASKYENISKNEIAGTAIVLELDNITDEDLDKLLDIYGMSLDDANNYFKSYVENYRAGIEDTAFAHMDYDDADIEAYGRLPKFEEFALTEEDKEIAKVYDDVFARNATANFRHVMVDSATFMKFDEINSFESGCKRCQYFVIVNAHPNGFDSLSKQVTK